MPIREGTMQGDKLQSGGRHYSTSTSWGKATILLRRMSQEVEKYRYSKNYTRRASSGTPASNFMVFEGIHTYAM